MGAGHCPWGGHTDRIVCNIDGQVHLASRYRAMLRPWTFSKFGTLPATLATCQYWEIFLKEAPHCPTTFGKMPNIVGTLPKVPHLTLPGPDQSHTELLYPKLAQKISFSSFLTLDLWPLTLTFLYNVATHRPHLCTRIHVSRSNGFGYRSCHTHTELCRI